jgi:fumarate hydratase class II
MADQDYRIEKDSLGEMRVPADALWGAQTQRAVENFPISDLRFQPRFLAALALIKHAAAETNVALGLLDERIARAIIAAVEEIVDGRRVDQFPIDIFQTGSGTSTNMNMNEVVARLATEAVRREGDGSARVHPNDHVNMGQSSNDTIPAAMQVAACVALREELEPALERLQRSLEAKAREFDGYV